MNRSRLVKFLVFVALAAPAACHDSSLDSPADITVDGLYAAGFEVSSFNPCDRREVWWVAAAPASLRSEYDRLVTQPDQFVYLRASGTVSPLGQYGHMGLYDREFRISAILEIRQRAGNECPIQTNAR